MTTATATPAATNAANTISISVSSNGAQGADSTFSSLSGAACGVETADDYGPSRALLSGRSHVFVRFRISWSTKSGDLLVFLVSRRHSRPLALETNRARPDRQLGRAAAFALGAFPGADRVVGEVRRVPAADQHLPCAVALAIIARRGGEAAAQQEQRGAHLGVAVVRDKRGL